VLAKWFFLYVIACVVVAGVILIVAVAALTLLGWLAISTVSDRIALNERRKLLR
jgi:hypothetical protein